MKKIVILVLIFSFMISMLSCNKMCSHEWIEANCQNPKTCSVCGTTEGSPASSHNFVKDKCETCGLIQLTLDNYEDYLECKATVNCGEPGQYLGCEGVYYEVNCNYEINGNTHYQYNDVMLVVKFSHYNKAEITTTKPYSESEHTIKLSLAGNGSYSCSLETDVIHYLDCRNPRKLINQTTYKIVSISGTVQEY